jgi:hypothetical protein
MQEVIKGMQQAARRANVGVTDEAIKSLSYDALQQGAGGLANLSFKEYLRMVDMGAGRAHPLGGLTGMRVSLQSRRQEGIAQAKDNVRKPKKVYSKQAYGKLTWLQNKLLHGYTEQTIETLKQEMQN